MAFDKVRSSGQGGILDKKVIHTCRKPIIWIINYIAGLNKIKIVNLPKYINQDWQVPQRNGLRNQPGLYQVSPKHFVAQTGKIILEVFLRGFSIVESWSDGMSNLCEISTSQQVFFYLKLVFTLSFFLGSTRSEYLNNKEESRVRKRLYNQSCFLRILIMDLQVFDFISKSYVSSAVPAYLSYKSQFFPHHRKKKIQNFHIHQLPYLGTCPNYHPSELKGLVYLIIIQECIIEHQTLTLHESIDMQWAPSDAN